MPQGDILGFAPPFCLTRAEAGIVVVYALAPVQLCQNPPDCPIGREQALATCRQSRRLAQGLIALHSAGARFHLEIPLPEP